MLSPGWGLSVVRREGGAALHCVLKNTKRGRWVCPLFSHCICPSFNHPGGPSNALAFNRALRIHPEEYERVVGTWGLLFHGV